MSLKDAARKIIVDDMFRPLHNRGEWKILVVDTLGKKIISTCLKMKDMLDNGITLIEDLAKPRQPLTYLDAVYFVRPSQENIGHIKKDFGERMAREHSGRLYKAAHLFFTEIIPDDLLIDIAKSDIAPFVQTVKELNLAFLPIEERVFSLDNPTAYNDYYGGKMTEKKLDELAEQLVTVCASLDEAPCPKVRTCNSNLDCVKKLAAKVQAKLEKYKEADILTANNKSQLIILDRGFDPISPFLHELTFQAMAYDLLSAVSASSKIDPVKNTYTFDSSKDSSLDDTKKEIILDSSNEVWRELRHLHISSVLQLVKKKTDALKEKHLSLRGNGVDKDMIDMKDMINKMPKYKREEANLNSFIKLAEDCMAAYNSGTVERAVKLEQDMSTGFDSTNKPIGEKFVKACVPVFVPQNNGPLFTHYEKLRVLILYVLCKKGLGKHLTKETLLKLIERAEIKKEEKAVNNMIDLGIDIFGTSDIQERREPPRKERETSGVFETSRWTPVVMDIMEAVVHERNLDTSHYPFFHAETQSHSEITTGESSTHSPIHDRKITKNRTDKITSPNKRKITSPRHKITSPHNHNYHKRNTANKRSTRQKYAYKSVKNDGDMDMGGMTSLRAHGKKPQAMGGRSTGPKLIIFVMGSISYSEMRCAHQVSETQTKSRNGWEVIIGSDNILTPERYLDNLIKLKD